LSGRGVVSAGILGEKRGVSAFALSERGVLVSFPSERGLSASFMTEKGNVGVPF
jgi:hypothetical protein